MERAETVRNPRSPESHLTEGGLRRKRNKERREAMGRSPKWRRYPTPDCPLHRDELD